MNAKQMALEALLKLTDVDSVEDYATNFEIVEAYLRSAELAQVVEPVAWINKDHTYVELSTKSTVYGSHTKPLYAAPPEPVNAWIAVGDGLPDIGTPVMAMVGLTTPEMYPMMRGDDCDGWLWEAHRSGPIDDPRSYEADDDYLVAEWTPLPKPPGATT